MRFKSREDRIVDTVSIVILTLFATLCLYPLVYCVSMSLSSDDAILLNKVVLLPVGLNLKSYKTVLEQDVFWISFRNSVLYTFACGFWQVFCTFQLAYVCTKKDFIFKKFLDVFVLIPMFFSGGLIPSYLLMKSLGLYDNIWAIILPCGVSVWNCILVKTYIRSNIPDAIMEAARIDGANEFQTLWRIVLPLSTTIIAIIFMYAALGAWNDYFNALIYLPNPDLQPLQLYLKTVMSSSLSELMNTADTSLLLDNLVESTRIRYVLVVVIAFPVALMYPFIQKYFVKGVMLGSVKG